jgi:hypothetical protein
MQLSDLHIALLGAAAVLLAVLFGYGKWKERQALRKLDASVRGNVGDPLLDPQSPARPPGAVDDVPPAPAVEVTDLPMSVLRGGRLEPRFEPRLEPRFDSRSDGDDRDAELAPQQRAAAETTHRASPLPPAPAGHGGPQGSHAGGASAWVEDPKIDWVIELRCTHAVDGVALIDAALPLARLGSPLPMFLVAWDPRSQQWVEPDRFGFYMELLVATQLASRAGRLDQIAASRFIAVVQQMAVSLDADFDVPDVRQMVSMAEQLDQTVARFDVTIGLTLAHDGQGPAWDLSRIGIAAAAVGMTPFEATRWELADDNGATVVTLTAHEPAGVRLTLDLDVPLAPVAAGPLKTLYALGERLARDLGAHLVDDNGRPVTAASIDEVAPQLEALYAEMRAAAIEPGGARAQRLYA